MKDYKNPIKATMNKAKDNLLDIADSIYQQGYEAGKAVTPFTDTEEAEKKAYNRGLNEAWDVARKLVHPRLGGYTEEQKQHIFGEYVSSDSILQNFTASEAIAKIKAYEDKQKQDAEIKVGDEVTHNGAKFIVLNIDSQTSVYCLDTIGRTPIFTNIHNLTKTGRHFDQIAEVLAELRGAENDE